MAVDLEKLNRVVETALIKADLTSKIKHPKSCKYADGEFYKTVAEVAVVALLAEWTSVQE
jgi:hypothetical protein